MGCTTCGAATRHGSVQCPDCARTAAERWRETHRARPRDHAETHAAHAHQRWWWQRRLHETRQAHGAGAPGMGAIYALASHHRELRAHEGVLWGLVALLAFGSLGVVRVQLGAGALEQALWAIAALASGLLAAELTGERESVARMAVIGPIAVLIVGVIAVAVESGAFALAVAMPILAVAAAVAAHYTIQRRRENRPVARQPR